MEACSVSYLWTSYQGPRNLQPNNSTCTITYPNHLLQVPGHKYDSLIVRFVIHQNSSICPMQLGASSDHLTDFQSSVNVFSNYQLVVNAYIVQVTLHMLVEALALNFNFTRDAHLLCEDIFDNIHSTSFYVYFCVISWRFWQDSSAFSTSCPMWKFEFSTTKMLNSHLACGNLDTTLKVT